MQNSHGFAKSDNLPLSGLLGYLSRLSGQGEQATGKQRLTETGLANCRASSRSWRSQDLYLRFTSSQQDTWSQVHQAPGRSLDKMLTQVPPELCQNLHMDLVHSDIFNTKHTKKCISLEDSLTPPPTNDTWWFICCLTYPVAFHMNYLASLAFPFLKAKEEKKSL